MSSVEQWFKKNQSILSTLLYQYRVSNGFTQQQMGEFMGVSKECVYQYERPNKTVKYKTLLAYANQAGMGLTDFCQMLQLEFME